MEVERLNVFDFKVILTEQEFNDIKEVSDFDNCAVEYILSDLFNYGFQW
ncbi:unnamed protein product [marine sediment metagenome]|uniref:Uncharacterized protein n=1 Tax=marine sediment metagenome TaxID=412755 RepID=X1C0Q0_9ZZZZ